LNFAFIILINALSFDKSYVIGGDNKGSCHKTNSRSDSFWWQTRFL